MEPTRQLIDEIYREKVLRARRTPPERRVLEGLKMSDLAVRVIEDGIRHQNPQADERRVRELLMERIDLQRRLEERPWEHRR